MSHFYCVFIVLLKSFTQNRNKRMTKDQAFSARKNIYYDQHGEALICSDSDEEVKKNIEVKRDFSHGEDQIIW
jgi:histone-lysine N-methyltransferase EZH2